ncbi:hypothetical protein HNP00_002839 [Arthrobacter sp. AZCC_0090]|nr:hypothetical protein [Arthrobacter sp. AZCC_0090]
MGVDVDSAVAPIAQIETLASRSLSEPLHWLYPCAR